jgi:hypothetical protein
MIWKRGILPFPVGIPSVSVVKLWQRGSVGRSGSGPNNSQAVIQIDLNSKSSKVGAGGTSLRQFHVPKPAWQRHRNMQITCDTD